MLSYDYAINTFAELVFVLSALLALVEQAVPTNSPWRARLGRIHEFFKSELIQGAPTRLIERYERRMIDLDTERAFARLLGFVFVIDAAVLVPLHSYRTLPHPSPTWEFALSPSIYYFAAVIVIIAFLRSFSRATKSAATGIDYCVFFAFIFVCSNVFMMHVNFLVAPKGSLVETGFGEPSALLYLDVLTNRKAALGIFMLLLGLACCYMMSFLVLMLSLVAKAPDYIAPGLARHTADMTLLFALFYSLLFWIAPGAGYLNPPALKFYFSLLATTAVVSISFLFVTERLKHRPVAGALALVMIPSVGYLVLDILLTDWAGTEGAHTFFFFALVLAPMLSSYVIITFSSMASLSLLAGRQIFGTKGAADKPFATLALFLALIGAISSFVALQFSYYAGRP